MKVVFDGMKSLPKGERRLAAIMFTDIVGYTALTNSNESQAMEVLERHNQLLRTFFQKFHGREVKAIGDSFLVEFDSALDALKCAVEIQSHLHDYNISSNADWKIKLRIGIHLGDIIHRANDVFGDAVNIASRIEPVADPGGICLSEQVFDQVRNKTPQPLMRLAPRDLKNVQFSIDLYKVVMPWETTSSTAVSYEEPRSRRIAILPFANMSPDPQDDYFADGMTEELISTLSKVRNLEVISRTSVMQYKKMPKPIKEISRELNAGTIVEGSVRKSDHRLRITVQMIDASADRHLWAQSYDRNLEDVFEVQSDVAKQVADALRVRILTPEMERIERKPTENTTAYTLYLKGRYLWNRRGVDDLRKAIEFFEGAVGEDPTFAPAYVGLADCSQILRTNWGLDVDANLEKAKSMLAKAIELDPGLAEAYASMGSLLLDEHRFREAEDRFRRSIELKPSYPFAHMWYHLLLFVQMRWDDALAQIKKALELDPLSPVINGRYALYFYERREYSRALELAKRALQLNPDYVGNFWIMAMTNGRLKRLDDMEGNWESYAKLSLHSFPLTRKTIEAWTAYFRDDKQTLKRLLPELEARLEQTLLNTCELAGLYFYLGEMDKGFEWLERSYARNEYWTLEIRSSVLFDAIRSEPRYRDLLKRLGLNHGREAA